MRYANSLLNEMNEMKWINMARWWYVLSTAVSASSGAATTAAAAVQAVDSTARCTAIVFSVPNQRRVPSCVWVARLEGWPRLRHMPSSLPLCLPVLRRHGQVCAHPEILPVRTRRFIRGEVTQDQPWQRRSPRSLRRSFRLWTQTRFLLFFKCGKFSSSVCRAWKYIRKNLGFGRF